MIHNPEFGFRSVPAKLAYQMLEATFGAKSVIHWIKDQGDSKGTLNLNHSKLGKKLMAIFFRMHHGSGRLPFLKVSGKNKGLLLKWKM